MKKGDKVMIYEDPITEQKPEGSAQLMRLLTKEHNGVERWLVVFDSEVHRTYERSVKVKS